MPTESCVKYAQCVGNLQRTPEAQCAEPQSPSSSTYSAWRSRSLSPKSAASAERCKNAKFTKNKRKSRDMRGSHRIITSARHSDAKAFAKNWSKASRRKVIIGRSTQRTALLNCYPISSYGTFSSPGASFVSPSASDPGDSGRSSPDYILGATGQVIALYDSGVFMPASAPSSPLDRRASTLTLWSRTARMLRGSGETEDEEAVVGILSRNEYPQDVTKWIFLTWAAWYVLLLVMAVGLCWVGTVSVGGDERGI
ncbi:hypothetical protein B0A48_16399 [Cryoendolithus antarcticus]|uniref:Uncharacterized protein n=1 Tax=Cryoendolithus antarcticus TaxID=1507870 RepID=A0A1V8SDV8_9PEZI|nr:hypothetical protein B0A48_16399 [Cryoendolithus antarcticus]